MRIPKRSTNSLNARKRNAWIWLMFAACYMFCVFAPLETYLTNIDEFWYSLSTLLPILITVFGTCFILSFIPYLLFGRKKYWGCFYTLLFFLFLGLYIQGNFAPRPYGVFDGRSTNWGGREYVVPATLSVIIAIVVLLLTAIGIQVIRGRIYKIASFICACILFSQTITIGVLAYINKNGIKKAEPQAVVTDDRMFELSQNRNIIVFLFDTFGADNMLELLHSDYGNALRSELEGFTFFPDTVGCYPLTAGAMPFLLEGQWYRNEKPIAEFIQDAYATHPPMYDSLLKAGYSIGVYYGTISRLSNDTDMYINVKKTRYQISDYLDFVKTIYKMVAFNYAPHQLKSHFTVNAKSFDTNRSLVVKGRKDYNAYDYTIEGVYRLFQDKGLSFKEDMNAFRFYYTDGIHAGYTFNENIESGKNLTAIDEAKGCMKLLREFIAELHTASAYNNTAIIVCADHSNNLTISRGCNPLFMVKTFDNNDPFTVSDAAVSYEDMQATYSSLALESILPGSVWSKDILQRTERRFFWFQTQPSLESKAYLPTIREYAVRGYAGNPESMQLTGNIYEPGHAYYDANYYAYTPGTLLSSWKSAQNSAFKYYDYGFGVSDQYRAQSRDSSSQLCFNIGNERSDFLFTMEYEDYDKNLPQTVLISVNGTPIGKIESGVPVFIQKDLIGSDGLLRIRFDYPDASQESRINGVLYAIIFNSFLLDVAK